MSSDRTASRIVTETAETIDAADRDEITRDEALALLAELDTAALDYVD